MKVHTTGERKPRKKKTDNKADTSEEITLITDETMMPVEPRIIDNIEMLVTTSINASEQIHIYTPHFIESASIAKDQTAVLSQSLTPFGKPNESLPTLTIAQPLTDPSQHVDDQSNELQHLILTTQSSSVNSSSNFTSFTYNYPL